MDLTQIRYFLSLARTLNFTRAAEACNVTQPALTRAIQKLEEELGGSLILRERSLTQLSELGRSLLPLLQATADAADAARARAEDHRRGRDEAPLRVGIGDAVAVAGLPRVLREVARRVGEMRLTLRRATTAELSEALVEGQIDAAILPDVGGLAERLNRWTLWSEGMMVLLPEDHPMAGAAGVPAAVLNGEKVVTLGEGHPVTVVTERLRREHGIAMLHPHSAQTVLEVGLIVSAGLSLGLSPEGVRVASGVRAVRLVEPELGYPVVLTTAAGRPMNRAVTAFVKLVRAVRWENGHVVSTPAVPPVPVEAARAA